VYDRCVAAHAGSYLERAVIVRVHALADRFNVIPLETELGEEPLTTATSQTTHAPAGMWCGTLR
jgi:hypothetical protein